MSNLITNAIKYGNGSTIGISLEMNEENAFIKVQDQGIGIAQENLDRIYERFERAVSHTNVSGLGLGLYITRQIVEGHGGMVWAESETGVGTTFTVKLPLAKDTVCPSHTD